MSLSDVKTHDNESPFDFDVWRCPECGYVVTIQQYIESGLDFACPCCQRTTLREYRLWPGNAPQMNDLMLNT